ncbi:hypothetical protein [Ornithinimicrobium faecis]|uniref:Uncharacterized protein n=1 Tax=Ornithinimicrobium faecis TaxID=2934158 RepID=A0ABY4YVU1_9MICO|nr:MULTISPECIES: hypothetical protein [unclassified Ornithinimicrobium]USQ80277.1 hypothetical protein NF556_01035 [Ornithinimicrobium sp. HY1793]
MTGPYAISPRTSPTVCPRCGRGVELSSSGLLAPHNVRPVGGRSCAGSGLTPAFVPPWPGTVKISRQRPLRIRTPRFSKAGRKAEDLTAN